MSLIGKLEAETLIKTPAHKFYEVFRFRPYLIPNICPDKIQKVDLHEGEWGNPGSVIEWSYTMEDGKNYKAKEIIEVDDVNKSITFLVVGGELAEEYKSIKVVLQAIPKGNDNWIRWTIDYEKLHKETPAPVQTLGFLVSVSDDTDDHLVQA